MALLSLVSAVLYFSSRQQYNSAQVLSFSEPQHGTGTAVRPVMIATQVIDVYYANNITVEVQVRQASLPTRGDAVLPFAWAMCRDALLQTKTRTFIPPICAEAT